MICFPDKGVVASVGTWLQLAVSEVRRPERFQPFLRLNREGVPKPLKRLSSD